MRRLPELGVVLAVTLTAQACQPADVTAARDQLGRGGRPQIQIDLPITIDPESVALAFGSDLRFDALTLDPFVFDYSQLLRTAPQSTALDVTFSPPALAQQAQVMDTVRFITDDGSQVTAATIGTGIAVRSVSNNTSCQGDMSLVFTDATGPLASFPLETLAADSSLVDTLILDGTAFDGFIAVDADADVGACMPAAGEAVNTTLDFPPLDLASVQLTNIDEPFSEAFDPLASEARIQAVDTVIVASGQLTLLVENRLALPFTGTVTLAGFIRAGAPLFQAITVPAAAGTPGSTTVTFDLTGATIVPAEALATVAGSVQAASATVTAQQIAQAITVTGTADVVIATAIGPLDPGITPELVVDVEEAEIFTPDDVDFGDLHDLIDDAVVDSAVATLEIENTSGATLRMSNLVAGVTRLDAAGNPLRGPGGGFLYETDASGAPLLLSVVDPGASDLVVAPQATKTLTLSAAPLLDRFMHLLNDSISVAFAASGTAAAGDGQPGGRVTQADELQVRFEMSIRRLFYQRQLSRTGVTQ